jgi:hypothetical protein
MSILFKRKLIATLILGISLFQSFSLIYVFHNPVNIIKLFLISFGSLVVMTYFSARNSNTITYWFRRKSLDERETQDFRENIRQIMVFNAGVIIITYILIIVLNQTGVSFNIGNETAYYDNTFLTPALQLISIITLFIASIIAIPLWRDKYVEDDADVQTFSKNYRWFLRIFAGLILGSIFTGFAGFYYFTMTTERTINGIEGTNGLETIG